MEPPMFRFMIRDVLWLTVVVALAVAWGVDRGHLGTNRELWKDRAVKQRALFESQGTTVWWEDDGTLRFHGGRR
jgi:hypothetical protein